MARRIAFAVYREQPGAHEAGYDKYIAEGGNDGDEAVQSALAAIIETTELAAKLAETHYESAGCHAMYKNAGHQFAQAFRAGKHYGKDQQ